MENIIKNNVIVHAKGHVPNPDGMDFLRLKLNAAREFHHIDGGKYAELTGVGMSTSYARTKDIKNMPVGELYAFLNGIGVSISELLTKY